MIVSQLIADKHAELRAAQARATLSKMKLEGVSIAGIETCIAAPELRVVLDLGRCTPIAVQQPVVLVSHGHLDHIGAIAQHAARRAMMSMSEGVYLVPAAVAPQVEALLNAAGELDGQVIPRRVVPLAAGESFRIGKHRFVRPFRTFHRVPSQGYTVWEERHRLREEFRGLPGERIGELRKSGVVIEELQEVPLLSFTGDTRSEVLEHNPELQRTEALVIETTFLDERVDTASARSMGHIHLQEVIERAALLPEGEVVLSHFSARYRADEIESLIAARLPDDLRARVRVFGAVG